MPALVRSTIPQIFSAAAPSCAGVSTVGSWNWHTPTTRPPGPLLRPPRPLMSTLPVPGPARLSTVMERQAVAWLSCREGTEGALPLSGHLVNGVLPVTDGNLNDDLGWQSQAGSRHRG